LKLKQKYGLKWIVDFRDPWTTIYYNDSLYQTHWAQRISQRQEQSVLDACDHLLLVSVDREKLSIDPKKVSFIPNGFDPEDFYRKEAGFPEIFTICYTGTIADSYPTTSLLSAFQFLRERADFKLLFVGKVTDAIKKNFSDCLGNAVEFVDFVSHPEAINFMMSSYLLLLMIPKTENNKYIMPGKVFEYLATGKPTLVIGPTDSKVAQIIRQANTGAAFDDDDAEGMKNFLLQQYQLFLDKKYPEADQDFIQNFSRKALTGKIAAMIVQYDSQYF